MVYKQNPKLLTQFQYCEKEGVPFVVLVGEEEKEQGGVKIRDVETRKEVHYIKLLMFIVPIVVLIVAVHVVFHCHVIHYHHRSL